MEAHNTPPGSPDSPRNPISDDDPQIMIDLATNLAARATELLGEMEQFRQRLCSIYGDDRHHLTGLGATMNMINKDKTAADTFFRSLTDDSIKWTGTEERFRYSNVSATGQVWDIVKRCRHVTAFGSHLQVITDPEVKLGKRGKPMKNQLSAAVMNPGKSKRPSDSVVNLTAIVDGGAEWIKVISLNEHRLLDHMAEAGWDWDADDDDEVDEQHEADLLEHLQVLRAASQLVEAAGNYWYKYKHPRVRFIFTRIREGQTNEIDRLIRKIRAVTAGYINVTFHFADSEWVVSESPIPFDKAIEKMLPQSDETTDTILLDTSVLISLISDITHKKMEPELWHETHALSQIGSEQKGCHFVDTAYPRICGKKLVCTKAAADQFRKITNETGSEDELARMSLLFGGQRDDFQKLSVHPVPEDLKLPVQILAEEDSIQSPESLVKDGILPAVALEVNRHLRNDPDTHLYGWVTGLTVVTGNRLLANTIVRVVEQSLREGNDNRDYDDGPRICAMKMNRALGTRGPSPKKARKLKKQGQWPPVNLPTPTVVDSLEHSQ